MKKETFGKTYRYYLSFLTTVSLLPILAPVLLKISESLPVLQLPAKLIYLIYSFTCHQFAYRSFVLFDYQYAWCARDTGIWLGMAAVAFVAPRLRPLRWYWLVPFMIPIALDGGIQTIATMLGVQIQGVTGAPVYIASNFVRFITGALFGVGISLWLSPFFFEAFGGKLPESPNSKKVYAFLVSFLAAIYLFITVAWTLTSANNLPSDILDSAVKTPAMDFYVRREWAPCPAGVDDLLNLDCLISAQK